MAIIDEQGGGPQWGPDGLKVDLSSRRARSRLGTYYARRKDGSKTLFSEAEGTGPVPLSAVRVYVGLGESAKASAYAPNALQFQGGELERLRKDDDAGR